MCQSNTLNLLELLHFEHSREEAHRGGANNNRVTVRPQPTAIWSWEWGVRKLLMINIFHTYRDSNRLLGPRVYQGTLWCIQHVQSADNRTRNLKYPKKSIFRNKDCEWKTHVLAFTINELFENLFLLKRESAATAHSYRTAVHCCHSANSRNCSILVTAFLSVINLIVSHYRFYLCSLSLYKVL